MFVDVSTYKHIREIVIPLCAAHGIRFEWLDSERYPVRDARSLFAWLKARGQIPVAGPRSSGPTCARSVRPPAWPRGRAGSTASP